MRRLLSVTAIALIPCLPLVTVMVSRSSAVAEASHAASASSPTATDSQPNTVRNQVPSSAAPFTPFTDKTLLMLFVAGTLMLFTVKRGYEKEAPALLPVTPLADVGAELVTRGSLS